MQPQETQYPGYFYHPRHKNIAVSKEADVINLNTGKSLKQQCPSFISYQIVYIPNVGQRLVHRLVAETFLAHEKRSDQNIVNHKDGDKENNHVDNLEWVNARENHEHAYRIGLRDDNRRVIVRHLVNDEEHEFHTLNECARWFDVNPEKIHRWLNSSESYPFQGYWNLRYEDGDWKPLTAADVGRRFSKYPNEIALYDPDQRVVLLFGSFSQAANYLGTTEVTIAKYARLNEKKPFLGHYVYFRDDLNADSLRLKDCRKPTNVVKKVPNRKPKPIRVKNLKTQEVEDWESVEAFAKAHSAKKNTIQKSVLVKGGQWKDYYIEYL